MKDVYVIREHSTGMMCVVADRVKAAAFVEERMHRLYGVGKDDITGARDGVEVLIGVGDVPCYTIYIAPYFEEQNEDETK